MKDKDEFDARMMQYSEEALKEREEELRRQKRRALFAKIRSAILGLLFLGGCVLGCLYHATIRDAVAKLIGENARTEEPVDRNAKLRDVMQKAKDHAATVDGIMDNKEPSKSP